jgi:predicted 3-demethylubiquinone-9 3-methyltransferase (glyoxalase superfamily)
MATLTPFLTYKKHAEDAAKLYCSIFPNSRIKNTVRYPDIPQAPSPGAVMIVELELLGQPYVFLNGGDHFSFTEGFSIVVSCETQDEIDRYWDALASGGGEPGVCGWLKDRFGVSWQVTPKNMGELVGTNDGARAKRVSDAMMKMKKIDLATLEKAARG